MSARTQWQKWGRRLAAAMPRATDVHDGPPPHAPRAARQTLVLFRMLPILGAVLLSPSAARADPTTPDPFWGRDKALHFGASALLASGSYGAARGLGAERWPAAGIAGASSMAVGALKEAADAAGFGQPSWKDFAWDAIGTTCGLFLGWLLDQALFGASPTSQTRTAAWQLPMVGAANFGAFSGEATLPVLPKAE